MRGKHCLMWKSCGKLHFHRTVKLFEMQHKARDLATREGMVKNDFDCLHSYSNTFFTLGEDEEEKTILLVTFISV